MSPSPRLFRLFLSCPMVQARTQTQERLASTLEESKLLLLTHQLFRPYLQSEPRSKLTAAITTLKNPKLSLDTRMLRKGGYHYSLPSQARPSLPLRLPHLRPRLRHCLREGLRIQSQTTQHRRLANCLLHLHKRRPNRLGQHYPIA